MTPEEQALRAHEEIEMIKGAGAHAEEDLVSSDLRIRHILEPQYVRTAVLMNACCFHSVQTITG